MAQPAAPPAGLVWDFDGLILDTESALFDSAAGIFAEHGVQLVLDDWQVVVGSARIHWTDLLGRARGRPVEPDERSRLVELRSARHGAVLAASTVRPGVVALLEQAAAAGVPSAVASSSTAEWVVGHLERLGLIERFAAVVTRDIVGAERTKPEPDLFLAAAAALGAAPRRCVALEDSPAGVRSARAASMPVVAVPAGITSGLVFPPADLVVSSLEEVDLARLAALVEVRDGGEPGAP